MRDAFRKTQFAGVRKSLSRKLPTVDIDQVHRRAQGILLAELAAADDHENKAVAALLRTAILPAVAWYRALAEAGLEDAYARALLGEAMSESGLLAPGVIGWAADLQQKRGRRASGASTNSSTRPGARSQADAGATAKPGRQLPRGWTVRWNADSGQPLLKNDRAVIHDELAARGAAELITLFDSGRSDPLAPPVPLHPQPPAAPDADVRFDRPA